MNHVLEEVIIENENDGYLLANITIKNGHIQKIESREIYPHEIKKNAFLVTTGFVNSHIHPNQLFDRRMLEELPITALLSAMHAKQKKTDDDRYFQAIFVLLDAIKSGATSMYAVASNPDPVIKAFKQLGLTGAVSCFFNDVWEGLGQAPKQVNLQDVEKKFSEFYKNNSQDIKIHVGTASILTASNELLVLFNNIAQHYNTKVNLHISEGKESVRECVKKRGTTPIRLLSDLKILNEKWNLIHVTSIDNEEVKMIAHSGASIIHCPVSNAKTGAGIAPMLELHKQKVNIAIGTDACSNNNTNNILNEAYFATLLQSAIHEDPTLFKEKIVFDWMTVNGSKMIDSNKNGKIKENERADLLLWHLDNPAFVPLPYGKLRSVFINNAPDIKPHTVFLNGNKIIENYNCTSLLEQQAINGIETWAAREVDQNYID